ncbi:MAG: DUF1203 domain-containing protein [Alphaproteobacteria bacterium]|nr:DUF1203 domain-containing protein [Alphaproteobacteria bacterium]
MQFRFQGLSIAPFQPLFALSDEALKEQGMRRMLCDAKPGFPCRVSLEDAEPGERVLLTNFEHQPAHSPYRAKGPIFVREAAGPAYDGTEVPPVLRSRLLSLRAYDADAMIVEADVVPGAEVEAALERFFGRPDSAYVHIHYAGRGCYSCRVGRA